jgi:multiple sugar transport system permease protein
MGRQAKDGRFDSAWIPRFPIIRGDWASVIAFLLPALVALALFRLWPFFSAVYDSVHQLDMPTNTQSLVGWANFRTLLASTQFINSVKVTLLFSLIVNPLQIALALALAVILVQRIPGANFLRTAIFLPVAVPPAVTALVWGLALRPDGIVNSLLDALNLSPQPFLTSPSQALLSIIVILAWAGVGYWMVFLIAGLKDIPEDYMEAAAIDGASWWQSFRLITLPLLKRTLAFVFIADTIVNFVVFAYVQVLTKGGPNGTTDLIMLQIYRQVYQYGYRNLGAAQTLLLMVVVLTVVIVQFRVMRKD